MVGLLMFSLYFYPRSPCGERPVQHPKIDELNNFYPRSPCGERRAWSTSKLGGMSISIHALLAESDRESSR